MESPTTRNLFFVVAKRPTIVWTRSVFTHWCGRRDSNSYGRPHEPKSCVSANFTTPAYFGGYRPTPAVVAFKVIRVIPHRSDTVLKVRLTQKDLLWCIFGYRRHCIAKTSGRGYPHNNKRLTAGSPSRARTCDTRINSPSLYQLSYEGIFM